MRLVAVLLAACAAPAAALQCYEGRVHDHDMHSNDGGVTYADNVVATTCPAGQDACCLKVEAAKCCNIKGRTFSVADGVCASQAVCDDAAGQAAMCSQYVQAKNDKCGASTCADDLCNVLGLFDSGVDGAARTSAGALGLVLATLGVFFL